jgi:hypothetical protein
MVSPPRGEGCGEVSMKLDREDMMEAVSNGVREAFIALGTDHGRLDLPHEIVHDAIRRGVENAIWQMITNATHAPCADFYEAIQAGVTAAMEKLRP